MAGEVRESQGLPDLVQVAEDTEPPGQTAPAAGAAQG